MRKSDPDHVLVYSTESAQVKTCSRCHKPEKKCNCSSSFSIGSVKPKSRIERKGRGGKTMTVIYGLPAHETFLKELCAYLKRSVGAGGTHFITNGEGHIEIQGEHSCELLQLIASCPLIQG